MIAGLEQGTELLCNFAFPSSQIRKIGVLHLMGRVRQQFEFVPLRKHYLKSWEEAASCRPQREPNVCPCLCLHLHAQSCLTLCNPIDPPGSPVHGIFQVRILQWVAISHSAGSSRPGVKPTSLVSPPALAGRFFAAAKPRKPITYQSTTSTTCFWKNSYWIQLLDFKHSCKVNWFAF